MFLLVGILLGAGCCSVWAWWVVPASSTPSRRRRRVRRFLDRAELYHVSLAQFVAAVLACGLVAAAVAALVTATPMVCLVAALAASVSPLWYVSARARKLEAVRAAQWPDAIDAMLSAIRAGIALPEALAGLAHAGPPALAPHMAQFSADLRALGTFGPALDRLKTRLSDPVADRVIEALRCAHDVGGSDLGVLLVQLSALLRQNQRTRGELLARQSWTVNGARLAAAAPWIVLVLLCVQPESAQAYQTPAGALVIAGGAVLTVVAYRIMRACGTLPSPKRTFSAEVHR